MNGLRSRAALALALLVSPVSVANADGPPPSVLATPIPPDPELWRAVRCEANPIVDCTWSPLRHQCECGTYEPVDDEPDGG